MNSDVSVVISTYRSAKYITDTLRSVFAQTVLPREIIVVDDCSSDDTCDIVKMLIKESPVELRLIQRSYNSGGPVVPMNEGIDAAKFPLIAMLDHDDLMLPKRIEAAIHLFYRDENVSMTFGRLKLFNEIGPIKVPERWYQRFGNVERIMSGAEALSDMIQVGYSCGGAGGMMFRKYSWENINKFNTRYKIVWDYDFALRLALANHGIAFVPHELFAHRRHDNNLEYMNGGINSIQEHILLYKELLLSEIRLWNDRQAIRSSLSKKILQLAEISLLSERYGLALKHFCTALILGKHTRQSLKGFLSIPYYLFYKNRIAQHSTTR